MTRTIYVYRHSYIGVSNRPCYYTLTYATLQTANACVHKVEADDTRAAKRLAAREHAERCGNRVTS